MSRISTPARGVGGSELTGTQVYSMSLEDPGSVSFAGIGGLGDQVRELREVIELPLMNPELFQVSSISQSFS